MKILIPCILFLCIISPQSRAQIYIGEYPLSYEAGVSVGPMNSLTDIGGRQGRGKTGPKDLNIKSTTLFGSIYALVFYRSMIGLRLEGTVGSIKSHDSILAPVKSWGAIGRYNRNLSFRSPIYEVSVTAEFHPITLFQNTSEPYPPRLSPYLVAGVGYFHFNPQANLDGEWIDLKPLHTEGQGFAEYPDRKEYKLNQLNVPLGIGILYDASPRLNIRLEYISRQLFTDFIDDVHDKYIDPALFSKYLSGTELTQALILNNRVRPDALPNLTTARPGERRGNPLNNDNYFTVNIKVGIKFGGDNASGYGQGSPFGPGSQRGYAPDRGTRRAMKRQLKCPAVF